MSTDDGDGGDVDGVPDVDSAEDNDNDDDYDYDDGDGDDASAVGR